MQMKPLRYKLKVIISYLHLHGNIDINCLLKQLIKCGLIVSCIKCSLIGFLPNAMAVVFAIANTPQSTIPFCLWFREIVIIRFSELQPNKFDIIVLFQHHSK